MRRSEDSLVSQRQGHVTRAQVREALRATDYDIDAAGRLLDQRRQISRVADYILDQRGLESGIGWPTRQEVEGLLARTGNDEGAFLSSLLRERRATVEKMVEIIHTDSVSVEMQPRLQRTEITGSISTLLPTGGQAARGREPLHLRPDRTTNSERAGAR